jgi:ABC-type Na+ transport system ATPase subunit NatA
MDVIGFLYVSLGSSTVQLRDSLDAHAHVHRLLSVVKMATVLEECITEEQRSGVLFFCEQNGLSTKDVHKEMFSVYGGKCLSRKADRKLVEKFSQVRSKVAEDA